MVVRKAHDDEEDSQNDEASHLDRLATYRVNGGDRDPVSGNSSRQDDNNVSNGSVVEIFVDVVGVLGGVANNLQDSTIIEGEAIKGYIETEP